MMTIRRIEESKVRDDNFDIASRALERRGNQVEYSKRTKRASYDITGRRCFSGLKRTVPWTRRVDSTGTRAKSVTRLCCS